MTIFKRYRFYKNLFHGLMVANGLLICAGAVALVRYFQTQQVQALDLVLIGAGTLLFGVILPLYLGACFMKSLEEMRKETEQAVARWVAGWLEAFSSHNDDPMGDPYFWLNIGLITVEIFGEQFRHPAARMLSEFAPMIKREIQRSSTPRKNSRTRKTSKAEVD